MQQRIPAEVRPALEALYLDRSDTCPCAWPYDPASGRIPRIMFGAYSGSAALRLIVVGKNPGFPLDIEDARDKEERIDKKKSEARFYANPANGATLLDRQAAWGEYCHLERPFGSNSVYHKRLMRTLRAGLQLSNDRAVLECTYFTEVVKCSSPISEQQKISREHRQRCISVALKHEINALPGVAILTLGREAEESVREAFPSRNVAYFHHPSYSKPSSEVETIRWLQEMASPKLRVE